MRKRKPILFLGLFLLLLLPLLTPVLLQVNIRMVQASAEERLEREHLQTLHLPLASVHWVRPGRELLVGQRLFDVKEMTQWGRELVVRGVYDDEETALENQLEAFCRRQKTRQDIRLVKFFQVLGSSCLRQDHYPLRTFCTEHTLHARTGIVYAKDIYIKIPYPPPQG